MQNRVNSSGLSAGSTGTQLAQALAEARQTASRANVQHLIPTQISGAYAVGLDGLVAEDVGAWKVGGANSWSQGAFGISEPFFGALFADEVTHGGTSISLSGLVMPLGEPEVMLELGETPKEGRDPVFSRMAMGIEVPATVLDDVSKACVEGQICDRAGAGVLWIATPKAFDPAVLSDFAVRFGKKGEPLADGSSANVIGGAIGAAQAMICVALRHNAPLRVGHWIASGGLVPAIPIKVGDSLVIESRLANCVLDLV